MGVGTIELEPSWLPESSEEWGGGSEGREGKGREKKGKGREFRSLTPPHHVGSEFLA